PLTRFVHPLDHATAWDRGFLRRVHFFGALPDDDARTLARFPPLALLPLEVQRGGMTGEGAFQILAHRTALARMKSLAFESSVSAADLAHVLRSPHLQALERLSFGPRCGLGDEAVRMLAGSPALARLRWLEVSEPAETGVATAALRDRFGDRLR